MPENDGRAPQELASRGLLIINNLKPREAIGTQMALVVRCVDSRLSMIDPIFIRFVCWEHWLGIAILRAASRSKEMSTNGANWPAMPRSVGNGFETRREPSCEGSLVDSAKAGHADAFAQLVAPHYRCCLQKAYSILRNYPDAEDETQNACTQVWEKLWQYKGEGSFGGWLNRTVSNQCLSRIRDQKSLISVDEIFGSQSSFRMELIDQRAQPEHAAGDRQLSRVLIKGIHSLPSPLRDVIVMRDLRQLAMQDVAEQLGISVPAAKTRLTRARCELKQRLNRT